jgi:ribosomal protein L34E
MRTRKVINQYKRRVPVLHECTHCGMIIERNEKKRSGGHFCTACTRKRANYRILFKRKKEMDELYKLWIEAGGTPAEL